MYHLLVTTSPLSDPITPQVSIQDSDGIQSSVTSGSDPVQPLTSEVSSDHPANVSTESAISNRVQSVVPKVVSTQAVKSGTESAPGNHVVSNANPAAVTPVVHISSTHNSTESTPNISLQPPAPIAFTVHSAPVITYRVKQVKEEIRQLQNTFINIVFKT